MRLAEPRTFPRILAQAINVATAPRPCAAYVSVPADLARMAAGDEKAAVPAWRPAFDLPRGHARHVLQALARARRPLIYLGSGAREALAGGRAEFHELVHALRAPVATSLRGKGLFPESDELSLGVLGMAGSERARAYAEAGIDTLVVIGSSLGEWATRGYDQSFTTASTYFHVDLDPSVFGQFLRGGEHIQADAATFLRALRSEMPTFTEAPLAVPVPQRQPTPPPVSRETPMSPVSVMLALNETLRGEDDLYIDIGNCTGWAAHHLVIDPPARIFYPCGLSSMGWSCGAVVGGKIGDPRRTAIALLGDGAFLMNGSEVRTTAKNGVGAVYVVLDDGYLGMVNHGEHAQGGGVVPLDDDYYFLGGADLARFAESLGADAHPAADPDGLREALRAARTGAAKRSRPQVVVARIDHRVIPPYGERFTSIAGDGS
ncbi:thiamine pyrophosphate-binding protein [Microbispora amethystogenes]|uniref:Thiamine pyrophosphate-binding protein n=1 Tax=Microbispora amethystogenes TaxID=1427754 RepID=A0ABQ4FIR6_9ACTN|nr:thiamine pyrophosphate-dependent enzyme [Microbispora amethystogenes]GIH34673.1 hypothetical protein Mam01_48370 [Microbispora amethystogenes]